MKYLVLVDIDYDPTGKHYEAGQEYPLDGWKKEHIKSALKAKQIEEKGDDKWSDK